MNKQMAKKLDTREEVFYRVRPEADQKFHKGVTYFKGELFTPHEVTRYKLNPQFLERYWLAPKWTYIAFGARWEIVGEEQEVRPDRVFRKFPGTLRSPFVAEAGVDYQEVLENTILIHEIFACKFPWIAQKAWETGTVWVPSDAMVVNVVDIENQQMQLWGDRASTRVSHMFNLLREKYLQSN